MTNNLDKKGNLKHHEIKEGILTVLMAYGSAKGLLQISSFHNEKIFANFVNANEIEVTVPKGCKVVIRNKY